MNFHPLLQTMIKTTLLNGVERALCPFCQEPMEAISKINPTLYCECSKYLSVEDPSAARLGDKMSIPFYSQMTYQLIVSKKMTILINVDFQNSTTHLVSGPDLDIEVPHIKFPFFNEMAMRHKLKSYLLYL